ncbi:MAG: CARDB domain-containing protein, partial [Candidatus Bipolaricaulaceae bacterium]
MNVCGEPGSLPVGTFRVEARRPSLAINKVQISPPGNGPIDCGGTVTWRIDVTNTGSIPIPYVWVEDELGSGFVYVSSTGGSYGVDNGCPNPSGSAVTWVLRNLPPDATAQLTLTARETGCGELRNQVRAWWGCGQEGDGSSCTLDADCLTDTYVFREVVATRTPNVAVSATLNLTQIPACGTATMTLEIRNPSSATASALDVRIGLPAGLAYVPGTTEIDCGGGYNLGPDPSVVDGYLYWYDPDNWLDNLCDSIPPGGTIRLRFGVQAACYRTTGNAAVRVYFYDCCLESQRQFDASFSLAPAVPSLTITKTPVSVPLDCFDPNSTVTWQIRVQNTGTASADWVRIEDTLGANLVYVGSNPPATPMGGQRWGWEFGPLGPGEARTVEITVRMSQPTNDCAAALRTDTAQAWWGCGSFDGNPNTVEGCTGGGPVTATARATIPDVFLSSTDIVPLLTCAADGNYTGRVQITVRNAGDANVTRDFRLTLIETVSGWSVSGYFNADFGGTLPIAAGGSRTITIPNWPVTCAQCSYSFVVTLDTENVLCECREDNNSASRAWTITLPDLTVRRHSLSLSCAGDGQARVFGTVTLGNEGCGSALTTNVPMRFTLRSGPGCTGNVLYTWTTTLTGVNIPAKGEQTFTISQTFPI